MKKYRNIGMMLSLESNGSLKGIFQTCNMTVTPFTFNESMNIE